MVNKNEDLKHPLTEKQRNKPEYLKDDVGKLTMKANSYLKWSCCGEDADSTGCRGGGECEADDGRGW